MLNLKYIGEEITYQVEFTKNSNNIVTIKGELPHNVKGFTLSRLNHVDNWDYSSFKTIYREIDGSVQFSNDGSVYIEPTKSVSLNLIWNDNNNEDGIRPTNVNGAIYLNDELVEEVVLNEENNWTHNLSNVPTVNQYVLITDDVDGYAKNGNVYSYTTISKSKENKIAEMNDIQQNAIQSGVSVQLSDGNEYHFTLTDHDQISMEGLSLQVASGSEQIPWHVSDTSVHCQYYSNEDMNSIITAATAWITYHVTYFRDLRIYINSLTSIDDINSVQYGMNIPEEYQSEVLKDLIQAIGGR